MGRTASPPVLRVELVSKWVTEVVHANGSKRAYDPPLRFYDLRVEVFR